MMLSLTIRSKNVLQILWLCLLMALPIHADDLQLPNVAVLPFVGDKTVSPEQLSFITGKFSGELIATNAFSVIDRGKMDFILQEQGFQQTGACSDSECKVQMGQLLGVDFLVSGNMVKFGPEYAFRIEYIDVTTGRIAKTVEISKEGELYQVYKSVCVEAAQQLAKAVHGSKDAPSVSSSSQQASSSSSLQVQVLIPPIVQSQDPLLESKQSTNKPMSIKRKIAIALGVMALGEAGGGVYFNYGAAVSALDYDDAIAAGDYYAAESAFSKIEDQKNLRLASYSASIATAIVGVVLWFWPE